MSVEVEIEGETEHQFESLLDQVQIQEGDEVRDAEPEELAEQLLTGSVMERYIEAAQNGQ